MRRRVNRQRNDATHIAGITFTRKLIRCSNARCKQCSPSSPAHGPYWYAQWRGADGEQHTKYFGGALPKNVKAVLASRDARAGRELRRAMEIATSSTARAPAQASKKGGRSRRKRLPSTTKPSRHRTRRV